MKENEHRFGSRGKQTRKLTFNKLCRIFFKFFFESERILDAKYIKKVF